jgi:hypothetical protein
MTQTFSQEEENIISFFAWSQGDNINEITQEMKEALYPAISQLPENSKRMLLRMGGILRQTIETPQFGDEFWNKNDDEKKSIQANSAKLFVNNLELNDELKDLYLSFAKLLIGLQYDESNAEELQEQVKLIVAKESN